VEAAYYILIDVYYYLVPVNEHEHVARHIQVCLLEPNSNKHQSVYNMLLLQAPLSLGCCFPLSKISILVPTLGNGRLHQQKPCLPGETIGKLLLLLQL
jgi:hypothetical protein